MEEMKGEDRLLKLAGELPDEITFCDEDGKDLGWGVHKLTLYERLLIARLMVAWHQSFETTFQRMVRSGMRSLKRKAATA
jgi:hypothetical protein